MSINFSNFISNFSGSSNIDIISSSVESDLSLNEAIGTDVSGIYFCIGDLLIQFNSNSIISNQKTNSYTFYFPYKYDAIPYNVMLTGTRQGGDNNQVITTLQSFDTSGFTFSISSSSNSGGWVNFIAIGPRPSSLYTSSS